MEGTEHLPHVDFITSCAVRQMYIVKSALTRPQIQYLGVFIYYILFALSGFPVNNFDPLRIPLRDPLRIPVRKIP